MAIFKLNENRLKTVLMVSVLAFLVTGIVYFIPIDIRHKIALPLSVLAIASLWLCSWQITLAFAFSALGDLMGSYGNLMAQMAAFAVAHVFFMIFFFERYRHKVERDGKLTGKAKGYTFLIVFLGAVLISFIFSKVIPEVPDGILKIGTGLYALIACMMLELALFQRSTLYAAGALLFVFSDFILSWELFVEPIQGSRYLIMIPYYLGQLLPFLRATPYRIPGLRKHRM